MNEYIETLNELTRDFLDNAGYPNIHMMWSEWAKKAKVYGLADEEITELKQHLEENKQLTFPLVFGHRRWWLTEKEIEHVEFIKQYLSSDWENEIYKRMQQGSLGHLEKDWQLQKKMQNRT